jgi:hypothetical protein
VKNLYKPHDILLHDEKVTVMAAGQVLYRDDDYFSAAGAVYLKPLFEDVFKTNP